jgi:hypothetical protein
MAYLKEIYRSYRHVFCFAFAKVMAWFALRFWMIVTRLAECLVMWIEAYSNAEINTVLNKVFATIRLSRGLYPRKASQKEFKIKISRRLHFEVFSMRLHFQPPLAKTWDDHLEFGRVRLVDC